MTRNRTRGDDGAALVVILVFVTVLGIVIGVILTQAGTHFTATTAFESRRDLAYAADSGVEHALQRLDADDKAAGPPTLCTSGTGQPVGAAVSSNGASVSLTCDAVVGGGSVSGPSSHAFVLTGETWGNGSNPSLGQLFHSTDESDEGSGSLQIGGPAYVRGGFHLDEEAAPIRFTAGLTQHTSHCPTPSLPSLVSITGGRTCSNTVPDPAPAFEAPSTNAPASTTGPSVDNPTTPCRTYYPGRYTSSSQFQFASNQRAYFASGIYHLHNVGEVQFEGGVIGGAPSVAHGESTKSGVVPCSTDAAALTTRPTATINGTGVVFILGGNSRLKVASSSSNKVELFARRNTVPNANQTDGVSVIAPRAAGSGASKWTEQQAIVLDSTQPMLIFHGLVYVPTSHLKSSPLGNAGASMFGLGLVASSFEMVNVPEELDETIGIASIPAVSSLRQVKVTATATRGGGSLVTTAVVTLDGNGVIGIDGWAAGSVIGVVAGPTTTPPTTAAPDTTAPSLTSLAMFDADHDGVVEKVEATFDEAVSCAGGTCSTSRWSSSDVPSGGSLSSVTTADNVATLTYSGSTKKTDVGSFTIALAGSGGGRLQDAAGNSASFSATAPMDKAGPVPTDITSSNGGGGAGKMASGDSISVTFSEPILASSVPTLSVRLQHASGGDLLRITGFLASERSTGSTTYITGNNASFNVNKSYSSSMVTLTLTGSCSSGGSGCSNLGTGSSASFTFEAASTVTDGAGNGSVGSVTRTLRFF